MKPLQLEFEATVYWVDPSQSRYVDAPSAMRRFRTLSQAVSFVLRSLPSNLRSDVRILTADKALMYDEVVALEAALAERSELGTLSPSRRFGQGQAGSARLLKDGSRRPSWDRLDRRLPVAFDSL